MRLQLRVVLNIGRPIKSGKDLSKGQEKNDSEFIHIANQAMINRFSILNHKRKNLTRWLNTWPKKKILVHASSWQTLCIQDYFEPHPWFQVKNIYQLENKGSHMTNNCHVRFFEKEIEQKRPIFITFG
jgi:hypothetical protein